MTTASSVKQTLPCNQSLSHGCLQRRRLRSRRTSISNTSRSPSLPKPKPPTTDLRSCYITSIMPFLRQWTVFDVGIRLRSGNHELGGISNARSRPFSVSKVTGRQPRGSDPETSYPDSLACLELMYEIHDLGG